MGSKVLVLGKHIQNIQDSLKNIQQEQHFQTMEIYKLCTPNIYISSNLLWKKWEMSILHPLRP